MDEAKQEAPPPERDKVFVCMPTHPEIGPANAAQVMAVFAMPVMRLADQLEVTWAESSGCSLLAHGFNRHYCLALNQRAMDKRLKFFAMCHADVQPPAGWLDVLVTELLEHDADLCSAAVPIKDDKNLTSTAISDPDSTHTWLRRLTLSELERLPPTFTAADCGYPGHHLLVNTGCFVCRLDRPWNTQVLMPEHAGYAQQVLDFLDKIEELDPVLSAEFDQLVLASKRLLRQAAGHRRLKVRFDVSDHIFWHDGAQHWEPEVEPEDWQFSRLIQECGGKVVCTKKLPIEHWGRASWCWPPRQAKSPQECDGTMAHKFGGQPIDAGRALLAKYGKGT